MIAFFAVCPRLTEQPICLFFAHGWQKKQQKTMLNKKKIHNCGRDLVWMHYRYFPLNNGLETFFFPSFL